MFAVNQKDFHGKRQILRGFCERNGAYDSGTLGYNFLIQGAAGRRKDARVAECTGIKKRNISLLCPSTSDSDQQKQAIDPENKDVRVMPGGSTW